MDLGMRKKNLKEEELKKICKFFSTDNMVIIFIEDIGKTIIKLQKDVNV